MLIPINDLKRHLEPFSDELNRLFSGIIESGSLLMGPWLAQFESAFASYCGVPYAVGVANGTDALELALQVLDCGAGCEVIVAANAGGYATTAILQAGAVPAYADVDEKTYLLTPESVAKQITPRTRAIIITHLYGLMADMPALCALAVEHGLYVIEDCAQAHGVSMQGKKAGTWGDVGCFSFYPSKNLGALGDAGCIVTRGEECYQRLRSVRQYGWEEHKYHNPRQIGRNSRMDEIQAAALVLFLAHLDDWNEKRRQIVQRYRHALEPAGIVFQRVDEAVQFAAHLCVIRHPKRAALMEYLQREGIDTVIHYPVADYLQPAVTAHIGVMDALPVTEKIMAQMLTIPCFPELSEQEIMHIISSIRKFQENIMP